MTYEECKNILFGKKQMRYKMKRAQIKSHKLRTCFNVNKLWTRDDGT